MTGMAGHDPGISGHVRPESLVTLLRNTHSAMKLEKSMRVARCSKFACEGVLALRTDSATKGQLAFFQQLRSPSHHDSCPVL